MDNVVLYGPGGASPIQLATWLQAEPGPNYGMAGLMAAQAGINPYSEGAVYVDAPSVRKMELPLIIASSGAQGGLAGAESLIRRNAVEGGYVDIQPQGVPSSEAVRFDILAGHWNPDYSIHLQRHHRRVGVVELQTKAYGYWPTEITLASTASIGLPGRMAATGAGIIGDVMPLLRLAVQATSPSVYETFTGSWAQDVLAYSMGARSPSYMAFWPAASITVGGGSLFGDAKAPASQGQIVVGTSGTWSKLGVIDISSTLEPAYRGAARVYAWMSLAPSQSGCLEVVADSVTDSLTDQSPIRESRVAAATVYPVWGASNIQVPTGYQFVDLGVVNIPAQGSGNPQAVEVRLWSRLGIDPAGYVATPLVQLGGVMLMPQESSGALYGWRVPTFSHASGINSRLMVDGFRGEAWLETQNGDLASHLPLKPAAGYRGPVSLRGYPSMIQVDVVSAARKIGIAEGHIANYVNRPADKSWYYRFPSGASYPVAFLNAASYGATGVIYSAASTTPAGPLGQGMLWSAGDAGGAVASQVYRASMMTMAIWVKRATALASLNYALALGTTGSYQLLAIGFQNNQVTLIKSVPVSGIVTSPLGAELGVATDWHMLGLTYHAGSYWMRAYYDGSYLGELAASGMPVGTMMLSMGRSPVGATQGMPGGLGEVLVLPGTALSDDQMLQMYYAGISPTNTPSAPIMRMSEQSASLSLTYRPQFLFLKGI